MSINVYGFIVDTAFFNKTSIDLNGQVNQGIGYLTDKQINHFVQVARLTDIRSSRTAILGQPLEGVNFILFDKTKVSDISVFNGITDIQLAQIFNIAETIYLSQNRIESELNNLLTSSSELYGIYINESVKISTDYSTAKVIINTETEIKIRDWVEFAIDVNGHEIKFKLWLKSQSFINDYPLSTVMRIVPPCDPANLLNPSSFVNILDTLVKSNNFSLSIISAEMKDEDHTGTMIYSTKYIQSSTTSYLMPFGVMYKGAKPSSLEIRKAIREYLIGLSITTEDHWKSLFPDLFVTAQFFIIPIYDNTTTRPDRTIYPSIINHQRMYTSAYKVFPNLGESYIASRMEIIMCGFSEIFSCVLPDPLNETVESFLQRHPTYTYHTRLNPGFEYQDEKTKEFNDEFNGCMAILFGEGTNDYGIYVENEIDEKMYWSFVVDGVEFHVLSKESYEMI